MYNLTLFSFLLAPSPLPISHICSFIEVPLIILKIICANYENLKVCWCFEETMKEMLPTLKFLPKKKSKINVKMFTLETAVLVCKYRRLSMIFSCFLLMAWCHRILVAPSLFRTLPSSFGMKEGGSSVNILKTEMYETQSCWWRTQDKGAQRNIFSSFWFQHSALYICVTDTVNGLENCKTCIFWPRVKDNLSKQLKLGYFLRLLLSNFKSLGVKQIYLLPCLYIENVISNFQKSGNFEYIVDLQRFLKLHIHIVLNQY